MISYELCQIYRAAEKAKMKRIVQVYDQKKAETERQKRQQDEDEAAKATTQRRWHRLW